MKLVDLSCEDVFGVIICAPTGIEYSNQAGGTLCLHPKAEGFFVPFSHQCDFGGDPCCFEPLHPDEPPDRLEIEEEFESKLIHLGLAWDRSRSGESCEAWIPVIVLYKDEFSPLHNLTGERGWLTYPNCD